MPQYKPSYDDMDSSYGDSPAMETPHDESKESVDHEESMGTTAIVPNKVLSPEGETISEGDEIVVRIVKNYGDESEIEYAPKKEQESSEYESEPMSATRQDMEALDTEGA